MFASLKPPTSRKSAASLLHVGAAKRVPNWARSWLRSQAATWWPGQRTTGGRDWDQHEVACEAEGWSSSWKRERETRFKSGHSKWHSARSLLPCGNRINYSPLCRKWTRWRCRGNLRSRLIQAITELCCGWARSFCVAKKRASEEKRRKWAGRSFLQDIRCRGGLQAGPACQLSFSKQGTQAEPKTTAQTRWNGRRSAGWPERRWQKEIWKKNVTCSPVEL